MKIGFVAMVSIYKRTTEEVRENFSGVSGLNGLGRINGIENSAFIYSFVENAKAKRSKLYEYVSYWLRKILKHMDEHNQDYFKDLL